MPFAHLPSDTDSEEVAAALAETGAVVLRDAVPPAQADAVVRELRPWFTAEGAGFQSEFNGYCTLRLSGILARSPSAAALIAHPRVLAAVQAVLGRLCVSFRLGSATAIEILPGERAQRLHRDDAIYPLPHPGFERQVSCNWALTDFTVENGATRLVPGSQHWDDERAPAAHEAIPAPMPRGSVLLYLGSLYHGGGANTSGASRVGLVNTYSLGWLRQEENMYLTIPAEVADALPERVRRLIGYQGHGRLLGWYPGNPDGY